MNHLTYFGLRYDNPTLTYLSLFAATPHPFNSEAIYIDPLTGKRVRGTPPSDISASKVIRPSGTEEDLIRGIAGSSPLDRKAIQKEYSSSQLQAIQRKATLRPRSLALTDASSTLEGDKGTALKNVYTTLRDKQIRSHLNDISLLDRYTRGVKGQLSKEEQAKLGKVSADEARAAKARLSALPKEQWDTVTDAHRALQEIRKGTGKTVENISEKTSPIGISAKDHVANSLAEKAKEARRTNSPLPRIPAYVDNPSSVAYTLNARDVKDKRQPLRVKYDPTTGNAVDKRLQKIDAVRQSLTEDLPLTPLDAGIERGKQDISRVKLGIQQFLGKVVNPVQNIPPNAASTEPSLSPLEQIKKAYDLPSAKASPDNPQTPVDKMKDWFNSMRNPTVDVNQTSVNVNTTPLPVENTASIPDPALSAEAATDKKKLKVKITKPATSRVNKSVAVASDLGDIGMTEESAARNFDKAVRERLLGVKTSPKPTRQALYPKVGTLLRDYPNISPEQAQGLKKIGTLGLGATGVLLGGSLLANSLIANKTRQSINRQEQEYYNPYDSSYPPDNYTY